MTLPAKNDRIQRFLDAYARYLETPVDMAKSGADSMDDPYYADVGRNTVDLLLNACLMSWLPEVRTILDIPCGHGRIMRHMKALFPSAELHACDVDEAGVAFCAEQFGAVPIISNEDPARLDLSGRYDLIWVGSLFTHLPREANLEWLKKLATHLTDTGIIVATFHGRFSEHVGDTGAYIYPEAWAAIKADYKTTGYGYADYRPDHQHAPWIHGGYGVSLSDPALVLRDAFEVPGTRVWAYMERGWAGHQDVLILGRPELNHS